MLSFGGRAAVKISATGRILQILFLLHVVTCCPPVRICAALLQVLPPCLEVGVQGDMGRGLRGMQSLCFPRNCKGLLRLQALLWRAVLMADVGKGASGPRLISQREIETTSPTMRWRYSFGIFPCARPVLTG